MASTPGQEQFLAITRKSQEAVISAIKSWVETVKTTTPRLASAYAPFTERLPKLPFSVPFADRLPGPEEAVASAYHLAEQLLASQRKFAEDLLKAMTPLMPGHTQSAPARPVAKGAPVSAAAKSAPVSTATEAMPATPVAASEPAKSAVEDAAASPAPKTASAKTAPAKTAAAETAAAKTGTARNTAARPAAKRATAKSAPRSTAARPESKGTAAS